MLHSSSPPGARWALGFVLPAVGFRTAGSAVQRVVDYYIMIAERRNRPRYPRCYQHKAPAL
ncbi:MAG: hypothetical protein ABIV47_03400 [Roseiflexaceae bacterium]